MMNNNNISFPRTILWRRWPPWWWYSQTRNTARTTRMMRTWRMGKREMRWAAGNPHRKDPCRETTTITPRVLTLRIPCPMPSTQRRFTYVLFSLSLPYLSLSLDASENTQSLLHWLICLHHQHYTTLHIFRIRRLVSALDQSKPFKLPDKAFDAPPLPPSPPPPPSVPALPASAPPPHPGYLHPQLTTMIK